MSAERKEDARKFGEQRGRRKKRDVFLCCFPFSPTFQDQMLCHFPELYKWTRATVKKLSGVCYATEGKRDYRCPYFTAPNKKRTTCGKMLAHGKIFPLPLFLLVLISVREKSDAEVKWIFPAAAVFPSFSLPKKGDQIFFQRCRHFRKKN